ncbi:hypothetical protein [Acinetobacter sp. WZC-1]|uniref:hypothetical protein n=1 Tax=Acinetobacter sp. WZC-1 TaxID=3459034 RepID=UPI00403D894A
MTPPCRQMGVCLNGGGGITAIYVSDAEGYIDWVYTPSEEGIYLYLVDELSHGQTTNSTGEPSNLNHESHPGGGHGHHSPGAAGQGFEIRPEPFGKPQTSCHTLQL